MGKAKRGRQRQHDADDGAPHRGRRSAADRTRELGAFVGRFPQPGPWALGFTFASILSGNGYLAWQIAQGDLRFTGIVLLVLVEAAVLSLLGAIGRSAIPREHRLATGYEHFGVADKAVSWIGLIVGVGGAYALLAFVLGETDTFTRLLRSASAWTDAGLHVVIVITVAMGIAGLAADRAHYRRTGPPYVSSVELESSARRVMFAYGAIVVAIPMMAAFALAAWAIPRLIGDRDTQGWNFIGGVAVIGSFFGAFFALTLAFESGPKGWAAVFLLNKVLVEGLFAVLPVLARRKAMDGKAASGSSA